MKTYYGTFTDINESDIKYSFLNYDFYFTSQFNKNKFEDNVESFIYIEEIKIKNKYCVNINLKNYLAVCFYKKVQKKGFRVEFKGIKIDENKEFA